MTAFDEATAVRRRSDGVYDALPDQRFALVTPGGKVPPAVNGGALIATVLRAVLDGSPHPHPVATTAHFLRVASLEPAEVRVRWLRQGKTAATARAALIQHGQELLDMTVTTGTVPDATPPGTAHGTGPDGASADGGGAGPVQPDELTWTGPPPDFPAIEDCVDLGPWSGSVSLDGAQGYAMHVSVLLDPAVTGWRAREPAGVPEMRGYFGLREDRDPDAYLLAMAVDGLPPVVFGLGATGWAPTVELTWYMRAVPRPGPLRVAARSRHVGGGWFDEEAEVWDAAGCLVAQSRQLARVGRGPVRQRANGQRPPAG
ncbi:MAG TPA: thioesterase family protein [Streptosporangiaceae bacterium]|nr:thioesterase family protein [Streptosporangiaceae bacterium]